MSELHWLTIVSLESGLLRSSEQLLSSKSNISTTTGTSGWWYCIMSQINVTVVDTHVVRTENWLCNRQTWLLCEFSCCWNRRQDCYVWCVGCRTNIFVRSAFSACTPRVSKPHVHVWSVRVGSEAASTGRSEHLGYCAVDRHCWTVWPLRAPTPRTPRTSNTCKTLNAATLVDVFQYVAECSCNT